jgi:hypothetical protein
MTNQAKLSAAEVAGMRPGIRYYDYVLGGWVVLDRRPIDLTLDDVKRFVPQSLACQSMLTSLIDKGESPGAACLMVLTLMPRDP